LAKELPTEAGGTLDQDHLGATGGRCGSGGHAGRSAADDNDVSHFGASVPDASAPGASVPDGAKRA
jgi:hypothetical protein